LQTGIGSESNNSELPTHCNSTFNITISPMINTKSVKDRRKLRFESAADAVRDAETLAAAEQRGTLRATGNWQLGQAIGHVATWAAYPYVGYPDMPRPPWFIRLLNPLLRGPFINKGLPAGVYIRNIPGGTLATDLVDTGTAIRQLHEAFKRLERETPVHASHFFGKLTREDALKLNLRHAELHFSFFHPE
jgi:hypothetical protein